VTKPNLDLGMCAFAALLASSGEARGFKYFYILLSEIWTNYCPGFTDTINL